MVLTVVYVPLVEILNNNCINVIGFYCTSNSVSSTQFACTAAGFSLNIFHVFIISGYYCPSGSSSETQFPCPSGISDFLTTLNMKVIIVQLDLRLQ